MQMKLEPHWGRIPRETKTNGWIAVTSLIFKTHFEISNKREIYTKYQQ